MSWSPLSSSCPSSPSSASSLTTNLPVPEQIKQVILAISLAFDNFIDINGRKATGVSETSSSSSSFESFGLKGERSSKEVIKFHRSIKRNREKTTGSNSSSSSSSGSSSNRKRSWESNECSLIGIDSMNMERLSPTITSSIQSPVQHTGKRSKSLVLTQELEGLCLSTSTAKQSSPSPLYTEMDEWAEQDFNPPNSLGQIERFDDLKRELDSCIGGSIDQVLKVLSSFSGTGNVHFNSFASHYTNHWIKWGIIHEVIESIKSPEISLKLLISRSLNLLAALNKISIILDWNDPEILFLLNKFILSVMNSVRLKSSNVHNPHNHNNSNSNNTGSSSYPAHSTRAILEFIGMLRVLNLFCRLPLPPSSFNFLLSHQDTSIQLIELLESFLDFILTVFEYCASTKVIISEGFDTFHLANCSVLLTLKFVDKFKLPEIDEIIKELIDRME